MPRERRERGRQFPPRGRTAAGPAWLRSSAAAVSLTLNSRARIAPSRRSRASSRSRKIRTGSKGRLMLRPQRRSPPSARRQWRRCGRGLRPGSQSRPVRAGRPRPSANGVRRSLLPRPQPPAAPEPGGAGGLRVPQSPAGLPGATAAGRPAEPSRNARTRSVRARRPFPVDGRALSPAGRVPEIALESTRAAGPPSLAARSRATAGCRGGPGGPEPPLCSGKSSIPASHPTAGVCRTAAARVPGVPETEDWRGGCAKVVAETAECGLAGRKPWVSFPAFPPSPCIQKVEARESEIQHLPRLRCEFRVSL